MDEEALRRREFLQRAAWTAGLAGAASVLPTDADPARGRGGTARRQRLPRPRNLPIDHFVIVMMENRSFDHYFGWLGDVADGIQKQTFTDPAGPGRGDPARVGARGRLAGLRPPRPGPRLEQRPRAAQGRLPRRGQRQRHLRAELLQRGRARVHPRGGQAVHALRPLLLLGADLDLAEPLLQVVGPGGRPQDQRAAGRDRRQPVGDDLRPRDPARRDGELLQLGPAVLGGLGPARRVVDAAARGLLPGVRDRARCRTSRSSTRRSATAAAATACRPTSTRTATSASARPGWPTSCARSSSRRNYRRGALFIIYDEWGGFFDHVRPPRVPDAARVERPERGLGPDGLPDPGRRGVAVHAPRGRRARARRPPDARLRVDPQADRATASGSATSPSATATRRTSGARSTGPARSSSRPTCPTRRRSRRRRARSAATGAALERRATRSTPTTWPASRSWPTASASRSATARSTRSSRSRTSCGAP